MKTTKLKAKKPTLENTGHTKALSFGRSGEGKTWFALSFPVPYYIDTEGGANLAHYQDRLSKAGGAYMGPQDGSLEFDSVIDQMKALATEDHPYKTLIIDSITKLYHTSIAEEQARLGDKDAFGASKKAPIAAMRQLLNWGMKLDMNILFIAHEASEWGLDPKTGQRTEIGKMPDVWDKLIYELDLTIQVKKQGNSRIGIVRKSRLTGFLDSDQFPLEYGEFAERYGKDFIEAAAQKIILANEKQVAEINKLLEVVNVPAADVAKALSRANAENFTELTDDQAAKFITWLKNKITAE